MKLSNTTEQYAQLVERVDLSSTLTPHLDLFRVIREKYLDFINTRCQNWHIALDSHFLNQQKGVLHPYARAQQIDVGFLIDRVIIGSTRLSRGETLTPEEVYTLGVRYDQLLTWVTQYASDQEQIRMAHARQIEMSPGDVLAWVAQLPTSDLLPFYESVSVIALKRGTEW